ncbi:bifunctional diguanylate cyclase/phosphodiesterase [Neobacillus sp. PS3-40]|uniref:putative bifunctional diguanylate cyclase/phosphodiesterase n=1 Tax=Neobacillus sp. PS3-40 TaxID=3070679 RepID=UPI0027E2094E|nr:bifunctional diguanylate cyclase/phosphodiesterase [Neobacillus sp. PS3-40]WML44723.1 bifunctional diguanylate cyclase/phosphodiesterase [Neobacillus sp. PS3-40]
MSIYKKSQAFIQLMPLKQWVLCLLLYFIPIFVDKSNGEYESIWFIYFIPSYIFSYYQGIKGGIFSAFLGLFIHGIWELKQSFYEVYDDENYYTVLFSTILSFWSAIGTGYLVEKLKEKQGQLEMISLNDELTNLWNRRGFFTMARNELAIAKTCNQSGAILFIDLDNFKLVNDMYGHHNGDLLLKMIAERLKTCSRNRDVLSRIGGDEFTFMLIDASSQTAEKVCCQIIDALSKPFLIEGNEIFITSSIGVSCYPVDGENIDILLQHADHSMYTIKKTGKNGYRFYSEMNDLSNEKVTIELGLRNAIERNEFTLHYQPQFDLHTGNICGVEALIRWNSKEQGLMSPADFIPIAEETNLIIPIGAWVVNTACKQNKEWQKCGYPPICVSVNISIQQFKQPNFIETVQNALKESELDPKYLKLEITESLFLGDKRENIEKLEKLKKLGVKISLDDFGSGYSSLSYIRYIPIDELKVDKSFIQDVPNKSKDEAIIKTIIELANSLDVKVVCEGIEKKEQADFLKQTHCDAIQGFYFSVPLKSEDFEKLQMKENKVPANIQ